MPQPDCKRLTRQDREEIEKARKQLLDEYDKIVQEADRYISIYLHIYTADNIIPIYGVIIVISLINLVQRPGLRDIILSLAIALFALIVAWISYNTLLYCTSSYIKLLKDLNQSSLKDRWQYNKRYMVMLISRIKKRYSDYDLCEDDKLLLSLVEDEIKMLDRWVKERIEALERYQLKPRKWMEKIAQFFSSLFGC